MTSNGKLQAEALRQEVEDLQQVLKVAQAAVSSLELETVLKSILDSAMEIAEMPAGSIALYDEEASQVTLSAHAGLSEKLIAKDRWRVKPDGLTHEILHQDQLFVVEDTSNAPFFNNPLAIEEGIRSLIAVPLKVQTKTVGILYLDDFVPRSFTSQRLNLLRVMASFAAMCIDNARLHRRTQQLACTDGLTGLYNHRQFKVLFNREMSRAQRLERPLTLLMLDVDNFKQFNDRFGHVVGDRVLTTVAELIRQGLRVADLACRYGGEEFAVILPDTDHDAALPVAERLRALIEERSNFGLGEGGTVVEGITVSVGMASYPRDGTKMEFLLKVADDLLYGAKRLGKNTVYFVK